MKIDYLDTFVNDQGETERNKSNVVYYHMLWKKEIPLDRSIVHCFSEHEDPGEDFVTNLAKEATKFFKLPCRGCWVIDAAHAVVVIDTDPAFYDFTELFNNWKSFLEASRICRFDARK